MAFKKIHISETGVPVIKIAELNNGIGGTTAYTQQVFSEDVHINKGDLLFSWSGNPQTSIDIFRFNLEEGWLNQHLFKVTPSKGIEREFLLQSILNTIEEFQNLTTGSTMKHIQRNKLDQVFVNVPNDEIMKRYSSIAEKERTEILHLSSQIPFLTEARDRLLPKLMNGEMEI